jgi:hypothetical protein
MTVQLRLNVDQISAAIMLLSQKEKRELKQRLPLIIGVDQDALEDLGWMHLAETSFTFWEDDEEEIYNDLIPPTSGMLEKEAMTLQRSEVALAPFPWRDSRR